MKVSPETARRAIAALLMWETPAHAAYQLEIGLRAVEPYSDRGSERVASVLRALERADTGGKGAEWRAALQRIAAV